MWLEEICLADVFRSTTMEFEEQRDEIVRRIKDHEIWNYDDPTLKMIVWELSESENYDLFNLGWGRFLDYADENAIWVETISEVRS